MASAVVYLVPTSSVSTEEITGAGILAGTTEGFDEPLARIKRVDAKVNLLALLGGRVEAEVEELKEHAVVPQR